MQPIDNVPQSKFSVRYPINDVLETKFSLNNAIARVLDVKHGVNTILYFSKIKFDRDNPFCVEIFEKSVWEKD